MEFVKPIYLIVDRCPECKRPHEFGPFVNDDDANDFLKSAKTTGVHVKNYRKEERAPLSDEQIVDTITYVCDGALKLFYERCAAAAAIGLPQPNMVPVVYKIAQASMLHTFIDFRPGCTVEHMEAAMDLDRSGDGIGQTVGGVQ